MIGMLFLFIQGPAFVLCRSSPTCIRNVSPRWVLTVGFLDDRRRASGAPPSTSHDRDWTRFIAALLLVGIGFALTRRLDHRRRHQHRAAATRRHGQRHHQPAARPRASRSVRCSSALSPSARPTSMLGAGLRRHIITSGLQPPYTASREGWPSRAGRSPSTRCRCFPAPAPTSRPCPCRPACNSSRSSRSAAPTTSPSWCAACSLPRRQCSPSRASSGRTNTSPTPRSTPSAVTVVA